MNDRELLELAAKAAGITWTREYKDGPMMVMAPFTREWNPLANDGDALRLAIDLQINIAAVTRAYAWDDADRYSLTRKAIVRAAAEIGKQMKLKEKAPQWGLCL